MTSTIMLATTFDANKIAFPAEVSIKLDGVAANFYKTLNGWVAQSRQGKPLPSVGHIVKLLNNKFPNKQINTHIVGELTVVGVPDFKTAAGIIRRKEVDERIVLNLYDLYIVGFEGEYYGSRVERMQKFVDEAKQYPRRGGGLIWSSITRVPVVEVVKNQSQLDDHLKSVENLLGNPLFEGFVIRAMRGPDSRFGVNKRSRGMMRYKPKPTVDLKIVGFEEATANKTMKFLGEAFHEGDGLRAVGRVLAEYKGKEIGVGPGCLTHAQRRTLWTQYSAMLARGDSLHDKNLIAEVEYMLDQTYTALRQPIFKQWRTDKTEASEES